MNDELDYRSQVFSRIEDSYPPEKVEVDYQDLYTLVNHYLWATVALSEFSPNVSTPEQIEAYKRVKALVSDKQGYLREPRRF